MSWYQISQDSSRVVYRANLEADNVFELYSVPIVGPAASGIKLNGALVTGGNVNNFQISPDNSRVVYHADQQTDNVFDLYSVPIVGPAASGIKLNDTLVAGGDHFQISQDSSRVVYVAALLTENVPELYSVPIVGPAASGIKLNGALVTGRRVSSYFQISQDSSRVIYSADQENYNVFELYSAPISGPAASGIKLNGAMVTGGSVDYSFKISPNSSRVVYLADRQTDNVYELYSVPINGPAASGIKLNGALAAGGSVSSYFYISQDSSRVLYVADQDTNEVYELYMTFPMTSNYLLHLPLIMRQY